MRLKRLDLRRFRNLGMQELAFPPEGVALVGDNAQGKSNLLEAIYYLETFRSFRGARDDQLLAFGEDVFRIAGTLEEEDGGSVEVTAAFQKSGRRKKVTLDGIETERIGDALGRLGAVIFSPADIALVSEGPSERRRFLDIVLSLNEPGYLEALQRFRHVLSQRNAALREEQPAEVVGVWDEVLIESGAVVIDARRRWIDRWSRSFGRYYEAVSGGRSAGMAYRPSVDPGDAASVEEVAAIYRDALAETTDRERRTGNTVVGPHRDEMILTVEGREDGVDVRDFGSGGQKRTAALALRLVEADTIRSARGCAPLVLLDDVFAELDPGRGDRTLELLQGDEMGQVILTAPKESDVRIRQERLARWSIRGGEVLP